jgi:hypothetical protein
MSPAGHGFAARTTRARPLWASAGAKAEGPRPRPIARRRPLKPAVRLRLELGNG